MPGIYRKCVSLLTGRVGLEIATPCRVRGNDPPRTGGLVVRDKKKGVNAFSRKPNVILIIIIAIAISPQKSNIKYFVFFVSFLTC